MSNATTPAAGTGPMTNWLVKSDISAALAGAVFKHAYPSLPGSMGMVMAEALVFSILARIVPTSVSFGMNGLNMGLSDNQKSEILIAILGALSGAFQKKDVIQSAVGFTAIDCLGNSLMAIMGMSDSAITTTR